MDNPEPSVWHCAFVDESLRVLKAEAGFCALVGASEFQLRHRGIVDRLHPHFAEGPRHALTALAVGTRRELTERAVLVRPGGQVVTVGLTGLALAGTKLIVLAISGLEQDLPLLQRSRPTRLTPTEALILEGLAAGVATTDLAQRVCLSRQGVEYHVGAMVRRFDAANRTALVARTHALGIFAEGAWPPRVDPQFLEADCGAVSS